MAAAPIVAVVSSKPMLRFDEVVLRTACIATAPEDGSILFVDIGYGLSRRSDFTVIAAVRLLDNGNNLCVLDISQEKVVGPEQAYVIVQRAKRQNASRVFIEDSPLTPFLRIEINDQQKKQQTNFVVQFIRPSNKRFAKFHRIRDFGLLIEQCRVRFRTGGYIDGLFDELTRLDGMPENYKSSFKRKDDQSDALATACRVLRIHPRKQ